jgi:large subunit ribosomal protein L24
MKTNSKPNKLHIRKGDTVKVIAGNSRGKTGKVLEVVPATGKAFVEGCNIITKHVKPSAQNPNGGIEKKEAPIHLSNLMVVDSSTGNATRVGRKEDKNGKLQRYAKKTGEVINNG